MSLLNELLLRRRVAEACIKFLNEECSDDPRYPDALQEYQNQLKKINAKIEAITGKPPATVIGLKTANLFGQVKKG